MNCPNCNTFCNDTSHFCNQCGVPLQYLPAERKGSHRVPILILVILSILGTGLFFATSSQASADMPCFEMDGGILSFREEFYTGSPELQLPDSVAGQAVLHLSPECFADCDELTTVILPDSLQAISWRAFDGCDSLRGILIPGGVTVIDDWAFSNCTALEAISIPASVTTICPGVFDNCPSLRYVFYDGSYSQWLRLSQADLSAGVTICCTDGNYCQGVLIP